MIQVIVYLLSNAAKFCDREAGRVTVRAGAEEGNLRVTVADNGRGIELEDRRVIFERFRQANKTMADRPGGTGLGLAISRQIVEFFGGRIWVDSSAGTGARITFEIPAVPVQGARALAPAVPAQPAQ